MWVDYWGGGGGKGYVGPPSNYWGEGLAPLAPPPSSYAYVSGIFRRVSTRIRLSKHLIRSTACIKTIEHFTESIWSKKKTNQVILGEAVKLSSKAGINNYKNNKSFKFSCYLINNAYHYKVIRLTMSI